MIVRTSAKSRLIRPGTVIRSVMPCTPWRSTLSASRKASRMLVRRSTIESRRSFGITISVSTFSRSARMPCSACSARLEPSNSNGRVTTPTVSAPISSRGDLGDDRRSAGAGAAALAGGDEHHVRALERLLDLVVALLGGGEADVRVGARAEALRQLRADVELDVGVGHQQRLVVGVDADELDALEAGVDHPADGVGAAAADADDLDDR